MKVHRGQVAAVTGAGSGIGRALAETLARRGVHLALCDVDADGLATTAVRCEGRGVKITTAAVDVADRDAVFSWASDVIDAHGAVDLVVNNAGVALTATVEEMDPADARWLVEINFWGVVHGTQAFLPHMIDARSGHIVNISSVFGLIGIPTQSAYCAAKFAVRGFTDSLRVELEAGGSGVSCTTVHPGGIRTNIARSARTSRGAASVTGDREEMIRNFERAARTSPERAAHRIVSAVERDRRRILIGADARLFELIARLPAVVGQRVLVAGVRRIG
ncbi:MAG: SDR family NAD(P)-dependent oxidoreductase [Actinobacteria bacterium]|nr:SDR family NAD(P)-dependent oxidoreductase [Actinomycetota bacterium]